LAAVAVVPILLVLAVLEQAELLGVGLLLLHLALLVQAVLALVTAVIQDTETLLQVAVLLVTTLEYLVVAVVAGTMLKAVLAVVQPIGVFLLVQEVHLQH
jgi:hypothetical protein